MTDKQDSRFIPALHVRWLSALYDPLLRFIGREMPYRQRLNEMAHIEDGNRVLDLACGTGTQLIMLKKKYPELYVAGLDFDRGILELARRKVMKSGLGISLVQGTATELPFASGSFERVISSLAFHHLMTADKKSAIFEVLRVLSPGGEFYLADFGKPTSWLMALMSWVVGRFESLEDNIQGKLWVMMQEAGFVDMSEPGKFSSAFGTITVYRGKKSIQ